VNVTIQNLVGTVAIQGRSVAEGLGDMRDQVTEALVAAVRDFQTVAN